MDLLKSPIYKLYKLDDESSTFSNDDTESVNSLQGKETDLVKDTTDTQDNTDNQSIGSHYEFEIEYEVESLSGSETNSLINSSDDSDIERDMVLVAAEAICDNSFETWVTDVEDSDMTSSEDSSPVRRDYWTCIKCKSQNNNTLFRYCGKCFQDRKTLFPPRPRHKKSKKNKESDPPVKLDTLRSCLNGLSQLNNDSGMGSSQECPKLGLDEIFIPQHLTDTSTRISNSIHMNEDVIPDNPSINQIQYKQNISNRKRQLSESSLSDNERKRPKWSHNRKSTCPKIYRHSSGGENLPNEKTNSGEHSPSNVSKLESVLLINKSPIENDHCEKTPDAGSSDLFEKVDDGKESVCKTSDLGSEISSGSGLLEKADDGKESVGKTSDYSEISPLEKIDSQDEQTCMFCRVERKNALFLHGSSGHMCCCYQCANKTWRIIKRCPICNRKVNKVVRVFYVNT